MIHTNSVKPELLALLKRFMAEQDFREFVLVGGTSIGLRFGYRESDDIDLFCHPDFDQLRLRETDNFSQYLRGFRRVSGQFLGIKSWKKVRPLPDTIQPRKPK